MLFIKRTSTKIPVLAIDDHFLLFEASDSLVTSKVPASLRGD
jgi:hypothetical protein